MERRKAKTKAKPKALIAQEDAVLNRAYAIEMRLRELVGEQEWLRVCAITRRTSNTFDIAPGVRLTIVIDNWNVKGDA